MSPAEWSAVRLTAQLAALTTVLLLQIGTPIAWWLARTRSAAKPLVASLVAMPLVLPPTVIGFYFLLPMRPQGAVGQLTQSLGLEHAAGRVALGGEVWQDDATRSFVPTHRRAVGYVIQESVLFPHLDVRRNLGYGLARIAPSARRIPLDQVVALLGIGHLMARRPATLSAARVQRLGARPGPAHRPPCAPARARA